MKFDWNGYFKPTPPLMRKVGMGFKAIAATTVPSYLMAWHDIGVALFVVGALGSFICNLFVDDTPGQ